MNIEIALYTRSMGYILAISIIVLCFGTDIRAQKSAVRLQFDNDWFTDKYYTAGLELTFHRVIRKFPGGRLTNSDHSMNWTAKYGFKIYTPNVYDAKPISAISKDRPFAGYQYLGFGIQKFTSDNKFQSYDLVVGQVGPQTGMEELQRAAHRFAGYEPIFGWEKQIANETVIDFQYEWIKEWQIDPTLALAATNTAQLGTSSNFIMSGFNLRLGSFNNIKSSNWLRPFISSSRNSSNEKQTEGYLITGLRMKYVFSNIFLEGSLIGDPSPVWISPRPLILEGDLGFLFSHNKTSVALIGVFQGREFETGQGHFYLNINIARSF